MHNIPTVLIISDRRGTVTTNALPYRWQFVFWPQQGRFGHDAREAIHEIASRYADLRGIACIVCEYVTSAPVVFALRRLGYDGPVVWIPYYTPFTLDKFVHAVLMSNVMRDGDTVVALSPSTACLLSVNFGFQTVCIPAPGIDYSTFHSRADPESRSDLGLPEGPLLIYAGRFERDKSLSGLLSAFGMIRGAMAEARLLLCITELDDKYYRSLSSQLDGVEIRRYVAASELARFYATSDLFVSCATSFFENLGLAPLEAIACGTPSVVPAWDGFRDYFRSQNGALAAVRPLSDVADDGVSYAAADIGDLALRCLELLRNPKRNETQQIDEVDVGHVRSRITSLVEDRFESPRRSCSVITHKGIRVPAICGVERHFGALDLESLFQLCIRSDLHKLSWRPPVARALYEKFFAESGRFF